ncbi:hypothetical protein O1611_g5813 [Lasiodiplodia mahajangana]|uniref:Uncharacterized protein n=1 Tax=Lasiodiplodia mahajangana TaxID=1108764 RepID=A0ACC2JK00_9PEZI|nr:hypothetical protein O1611_g5813 [Lasiodiplodia mahajangana]
MRVKPDLDLGLDPELGIFTEEDLELIFETIGVRPDEPPEPGEFDWIVDEDDDDSDDDEGYASGGDAGSSSDCSMSFDEDSEDESGEYDDDEMLDLDWMHEKTAGFSL